MGNDEHLLQIAKACKKIERVSFLGNHSITDQGIINGFFAHCPSLNYLDLFYCEKITGLFISQLPRSVKTLIFHSFYDVSKQYFSLLNFISKPILLIYIFKFFIQSLKRYEDEDWNNMSISNLSLTHLELYSKLPAHLIRTLVYNSKNLASLHLSGYLLSTILLAYIRILRILIKVFYLSFKSLLSFSTNCFRLI